jgi:hypothetical protein
LPAGGVSLADNRASRAVNKPKPIIIMKATKLLLTAVLFTGVTSLSFAGPGIDYWNRMAEAAKNRTTAEAKAKTNAPAKASASAAAQSATEVAASCATCECCAKKV